MNILFNTEENRFRAGVRITVFILLFILFVIPSSLVDQRWVSYLLLSLGCFFVAFLAIKGLDKRNLSDIGLLVNKQWFIELGLGILLAFIAQTFIFSTEVGFGWLEINGFGWERTGSEYWLRSFAGYFLMMLSVGFYEELLFRGYPLINLTEGFTVGNITPEKAAWFASILTSVLFGVAHASNPNANFISTFNIVLAGLMLSVPILLTGRLAFSIGIHFSWNWVMGGIYGLPVSGLDGRRSLLQTIETGPDFWTGGRFGPEAGMLGILAMLLILVLILVYVKKQNNGRLTLHESFRRKYQPIEIDT